MAKTETSTAAVPVPQLIASQLVGELIHASDVAHMVCAAMVAQNPASLDAFGRVAAQIEQGWLAMEANSEPQDQAAIAWARRRMGDFIQDLGFGIVTSANRSTALAELFNAALPDTNTADPAAAAADDIQAQA